MVDKEAKKFNYQQEVEVSVVRIKQFRLCDFTERRDETLDTLHIWTAPAWGVGYSVYSLNLVLILLYCNLFKYRYALNFSTSI